MIPFLKRFSAEMNAPGRFFLWRNDDIILGFGWDVCGKIYPQPKNKVLMPNKLTCILHTDKHTAR